LTAAPKEYVSILTAEQRSKGIALRLTDLESAMTQHWRQTTGTLSAAEEGNEVTLLGFNGICYNCPRSLDIGQMNVQKRRIGTPEDETTTTIKTFPEEEEVEAMAMAETRILNLKAIAVTAESRDMPKQPVGCFRAM
jgi:hypothetical protein